MTDIENPQLIDVSKVMVVPTDTEVPVHDNLFLTVRPLCASFPENSVILDNLDKVVQVVEDITYDIEEESGQVNNAAEHLDELLVIFDPLNVQECSVDLFKDGEYTVISDLQELKNYLSELLMRFDTCPGNYTKEDYQYLLSILKGTLLYLYENYTKALEPNIKVNTTKIPKVDDYYQISINAGDHISVENINYGVRVSAITGSMNELNSTKIATVNDIRNYIEQRLEWQIQ